MFLELRVVKGPIVLRNGHHVAMYNMVRGRLVLPIETARRYQDAITALERSGHVKRVREFEHQSREAVIAERSGRDRFHRLP